MCSLITYRCGTTAGVVLKKWSEAEFAHANENNKKAVGKTITMPTA